MADFKRVSGGVPNPSPNLVSADQVTILGDGTTEHPLHAAGGVGESDVTNVKDFGAKGDGVTDDHAAITRAIASFAATGKALYFPEGVYRVGRFLYLLGLSGLRIFGDGATILYPSDDVSIQGADFPPTAGVAAPNTAARSAFFFDHCSDVVVEPGLSFLGGNAQEITTVNVGGATYLRHCVGQRMDYVARAGGPPMQQEAAADSTGTGSSLLPLGEGLVLLSAPGGSFTPGAAPPRSVTLGGPLAHAVNGGTFPIVSFVSSGQIVFRHPGAIAESSSFAWSIDDGDRLTRLRVTGYGCRGPITPGPRSVLRGSLSQPIAGRDLAGVGDSLTASGTQVTLIDAGFAFDLSQNLVGKYVRTSRWPTPGNNGWFQIASATPATRYTPGRIVFDNPAGASEISEAGIWWIQNGDVTGIGAGAGALSFDPVTNLVTLRAAVPSFDATMIGMVIRPADTTSPGNAGGFVIQDVPSPTEVRYLNSNGASEDFFHGWGIDAYDNGHVDVAGTEIAFGSTHGVYAFAGRFDIDVEMSFSGIRADATKFSGSESPVSDIRVHDCTFLECGAAFVGGADDSQAHVGLSFRGNQIVDCGTGRPGWNEQVAVTYLGSKGNQCSHNQFWYTRNAIAAVDGTDSVAGYFGIFAGRFLAGISQPVEDFVAIGNQFYRALGATTPDDIVNQAIHLNGVGLRARYRTGGTLTGPALNPITGLTDLMTLTDDQAQFSQEMVGAPMQLVFCADPANDVFSVVQSVTGNQTLTFANASGVAGAVGTYRIQGLTGTGQLGAEIVVADTHIHGVGQQGIAAISCTAPQIVDAVIGGLERMFDLSLSSSPRLVRARVLGRGSINAAIRIDSGTSWPVIDDNPIVSSGATLGSGIASRGDLGIGVDSDDPVDYPLLGVRGRVQPSDGREEVVFSFGSNWVDGDSFRINGGPTYTYKAVAPSPGLRQFNSQAGLIALLTTDGLSAADYGATFAVPVVTGHIRLRNPAPTTVDNNLDLDTFNLLNPTALVAQRNRTGGNEAFLSSRGSASPGPVPDKAVVWSPCATLAGNVALYADDASAQTLLQANGYRALKDSNNAGCCEVVTFGASAGTEEFRWNLH